MDYLPDFKNVNRYNNCYKHKTFKYEKEFTTIRIRNGDFGRIYYDHYLDGKLHNRFGQAQVCYRDGFRQYGAHYIQDIRVSYSDWTRYPITLNFDI